MLRYLLSPTTYNDKQIMKAVSCKCSDSKTNGVCGAQYQTL